MAMHILIRWEQVADKRGPLSLSIFIGTTWFSGKSSEICFIGFEGNS